jgi:aryl-alcohol dehydrogenase-like predicted oxidoreductase
MDFVKTILIPNTDLRVSRLALGTAQFGARLSSADARALLDAYVILDGNFIDTASVYSDWIPGTKSSSEKIIGAWLKENGLRDQIVLATKGAHPELSSMTVSRLSPAEIAHDVRASLENLGTDRIDLYWLHRDDRALPVDAIIDSLNEHVQAGHIRYFGASNWKPDRIQAANDYAAQHGLHGFVADQPQWSLAVANADKLPDQTTTHMDQAALDFHRRTGMAAVAYSSQAHGYFSKLDADQPISANDHRDYDNEVNPRRLTVIQALARQHNASINDIVLAYVLSQTFPTVAVIGPGRVDQLHSSMSALNVTLSSAEIAALENA